MPAQPSETQPCQETDQEGSKNSKSIGGKNGGTEEDREDRELETDREKLADAAKEQAIRLLARRDHSRLELQRKLALRGYPADIVEATVAHLANQGLQSDQRFAESFVRSALNRGHGERKIRAGLRPHGIDDRSITALQDMDDEQWLRLANKAAHKRFGESPPKNNAELAKRGRFLVNRGFHCSLVLRVFTATSPVED